MTRLPKLPPSDLTDEQRRVYDTIAGGPRAQGKQLFRLKDDDGGLEGPFNAFLLQPELGDALQALGAAVRYATGLTDRQREIAILVGAYHWHSEFEIYAHEAVGRAAGLTDDELTALRESRFDVFTDPAERAVAQVCHAAGAHGDLDDDAYHAALETLGEVTIFELLTLVGYYATLALQLRIFRIPTPT